MVEMRATQSAAHVPEGAADAPTLAVDRELQAAIEYKIALSGVAGVDRVLHFVQLALCRYVYPVDAALDVPSSRADAERSSSS
jgi:hypothetical protein